MTVKTYSLQFTDCIRIKKNLMHRPTLKRICENTNTYKPSLMNLNSI